MRILFALAGLHRIDRGAEIAFIAVASELAGAGHEITLIGSGPRRPGAPYNYLRAPAVSRTLFERFPRLPSLRNETSWEEATFVPGLLARYRPAQFDVTVTCAFPFTHWALRRPVLAGPKPRYVFVTQNGDWPAQSNDSEFRFFDCDGLVCINPDYFERNRDRYRCALIPNGVDLAAFAPGPAQRTRFGLPADGPIILMVSALIASKNVAEGIAAVARLPGATLVVAGDGPLRDDLQQLANELIPGRYHRLTLRPSDMPDLYRTADAFMHLSMDEPFGNVFVEAMATGLPIIAYENARTRWIVGDGGFFPNDTSSEALAASITTALLAGKRGVAAAQNRAKSFGWSSIGKQYEQFFMQIVR